MVKSKCRNKSGFLITKSTGKKITLEKQPSEAYSTGGAASLVDGIRGNMKNHGKSWLGFSGKDVVATIDFGAKTDFTSVQFSTLERPEAGSIGLHLLKFMFLITELTLEK